MKYKSRTKKRSTLSKTQKKEVRKIAQKEIDTNNEDKHLIYQQENINMNHNTTIYVGNFLSDLQQGVNTGDDGVKKTVRIGDRIKLKNINMRFWLSNKLDRPNVMYKGILFWYQSNIGSAIVDSDVYLTNQNRMLDRYNVKQIKVVDTFIIQSKDNYAQPYYYPVGGTVAVLGKEKSYLATLNKSYKNKYIQYDTNGKIPKGWQLAFGIVCYDAYGTLPSDNIASYALNSQITFEDA